MLNLRKEFETLKTRKDELVKERTDRLLKVVKQIKVLGEELLEKSIGKSS